MITSETRHTLRDLLIHGELDGYTRILTFPTCPICQGPMTRSLMRRPAGFLHAERVKILYECRDPFCGQTEVVG